MPSIRDFFFHLLVPHYRHPSGLLGRWAGRRMAEQHRPENLWTVALLAPRPGDRILEVGFGPGMAIAELVQRLHGAGAGTKVVGLDASQTMVGAAGRRNRVAIENGLVELHQGDVAALPFPSDSFDKAFSIHGIYLWPDAPAALAELRRVLKPGGLLALTFLPRERWAATGSELPETTAEFHPYFSAELYELLRAAGYQEPYVTADDDPAHLSSFTLLARA